VKKIVVELAGPSGVGKTFLLHRLEERLGILRPALPPITLRHRVKAAAVWPFIVMFPRQRHGVYSILKRKVATWEFVEHQSNGVFLIEEGPWHYLCETLGRRLPRWMARLVSNLWGYHLDLPNIVVYLCAAPEFLRQRRLQRARKAEKSTNLHEIMQSVALFDYYFARLRQKHPDTIVLEYHIDRDTDIEKIVDGITEHICDQINGMIESFEESCEQQLPH